MEDSIGAYEAKTRLAELLDRVERGEAVTITRRGVPVARLVPAQPAKPSAEEAVRQLFALREKLKAAGVQPFTHEEIVDLIQTGRRS
jgi:prevent-host-death family protein